MVAGFQDARDFAPVVGWQLYQVTLDKYHVMFFFEGGLQLLNVAHCFSHHSRDGTVSYAYETDYARDTDGKCINNQLGRLLHKRVTDVSVESERELALVFDNGDKLVVHDHPRFRSWWFLPVADPAHPEKAIAWAKSDEYGEED